MRIGYFQDLSSSSVVVFDEAHNIDNVCIDSMSVAINRKMLDIINANLVVVENRVRHIRQTDAGQLQEEYNKLVITFSFFFFN